jgi:hypothetical protein
VGFLWLKKIDYVAIIPMRTGSSQHPRCSGTSATQLAGIEDGVFGSMLINVCSCAGE